MGLKANDVFSLIDDNYRRVGCAGKYTRKGIRQTPESNKTMRANGVRERKRLLEKLEKAKDKLTSISFAPGKESKVNDKLMKKSLKVAELEAQIKSFDGIPYSASQVKQRALKLKKGMADNFFFNAHEFRHMVDDKKKKEIFAEERPVVKQQAQTVQPVVSASSATPNATIPNVALNGAPINQRSQPVMASVQKNTKEDVSSMINYFDRRKQKADLAREANDGVINVIPSDADRRDISGSVNASFVAAKQEPVVPTGVNQEPVYDGFLGNGSMFDKPAVISKDEVERVVNGAYESIKLTGNTTEGSVVSDTVNEMVAGDNENVQENIRVSSGGKPARINLYDREGQFMGDKEESNVNYVYKPMTDEEIAKARENIEFDKYEELYRNNRGPSEKTEWEKAIESYQQSVKDAERAVDDYNSGRENEDGREMDLSDLNHFREKMKEASNNAQAAIQGARDEINEGTNNVAIDAGNMQKAILQVPAIKFEDIFQPAANSKIDNDETPVIEEARDFPVVVPERQMGVMVDAKEKEPEEENLSFDYSEATFGDVVSALDKVSSSKDVSALMSRAKELLQEQRNLFEEQAKTKREKEAAEALVEERARKAREAQENAEKVYKMAEDSLRALADYNAALEEDCQFNQKKTEEATQDAESNMKFIDEQNAKVDAAMAIIEEVNAVVSPEAYGRGK